MTPPELAKEITKAFPANSLQQNAALVGCRRFIDEIICRVLNVGPGQDLTKLVRDAARYRWLRAQSPGAVCAIAWRVKAACAFGTPDEATDAAMAALPNEEGA